MKYFFENPKHFSILYESINSIGVFCIFLKFGIYIYKCFALENTQNELVFRIFLNHNSSCYNVYSRNFPPNIISSDTELIRSFILDEFNGLIKDKTIKLNMF